MKLSIVIPARDESASIGTLVRRLHDMQLAGEIIVVDDGSIDDTGAIAKAAGARVIRHPYGMGNGAAIKNGARAANGDILVFLDADGQHDPADIPRLLERIEEGYDMVVGARQNDSQATILRGLANRFYNRLASYMTGHRIDDLTSGFRAVKANRFREFLYLLPNGFSYPTTITMALFRAGYSVVFEPIEAGKRIGKSHISAVTDGIRFLLIILKIGTLYSPLKLFAPISLILFLAASGWYGYTLATMGRFTNMSTLLFTGSIMVLLMGLISEQITTLMYKDSNGERDP